MGHSNKSSNALLQELARIIAMLEGAEAAMVSASGMASISAALLTFLHSGDHFLVQNELYGGTSDFIKKNLPDMGIKHTDISSRDPSSWEALLTPQTKVRNITAL